MKKTVLIFLAAVALAGTTFLVSCNNLGPDASNPKLYGVYVEGEYLSDFDADTTNYTLTFPSCQPAGVTNISITGQARSATAIVSGGGEDIEFSEGVNNLNIVVVSADRESTMVYRFTVVIGDALSQAGLDVSFDEVTGGDIVIDNNSPYDVVVFKDSVATENVVGGVRGNTTGHNLSITETGEYVLRVVTYRDLTNNINSLSTCREVFSQIVYVDGEEKYISINSNISETADNYALFNNQTGMNVEVRVGSWSGYTVCYLTSYQTAKKIYLPDGAYYFYPIFKIPYGSGGSVISAKGDLNDVIIRQVGNTVVPIDISEPSTGFSYPFAYIKITNTTANGLTFMNGAQIVYNVNGGQIINPGETATYEIASTSKGQTYSTFKVRDTSVHDVPSLIVVNGQEYLFSVATGGTTTIVSSNTIQTLSAEALLTDLTLDGSTLSGFSGSNAAYSVSMPAGTTSVTIGATKSDANATVSGEGTKTLSVGENTFAVVVTAENGYSTRTYTISILVADTAPTIESTYTEAELTSGSDAKWFTFDATSGTSYDISWNDSWDGDDTMTADVLVTVYRADKTTTYGGAVQVDSGYSSALSITGAATEKVYIKVVPYDSSSYGTFAIKVQ